jgi:hypothetical protein
MSGGWTVVDTATNKSLPVGGSQNSGTGVPYVTPAPSANDPVQKFRISSPQSLIDTDFEYGTQPTKWESISLQNNRPSVYYIPQLPVTVSAITGTATADQVTITFTGSIPNNTPIYIQNSLNSTINGWGYVITGGTNTTVTVVFAPGTVTQVNGTAYFSATSTYVYLGYYYSGSGIQVGSNAIVVTSATVLTVTTVGAHGLNRGSFVYLNGAAIAGGATGVVGAYVVASVPTFNTFTVTASGSASGSPTNSAGNNVIYARPSGYVEPRTFDGGVAFSAGSSVPSQQLIRQTRRYFRYQSGKVIQFSTGSSLKPALFVSSLVNASGTVSVTCRFNHNLTAGTSIQVAGANQGYFNGTFTVASVTSPTVFTYTIGTSNSVTATGQLRVSPLNWYGASSRIGFFDQQNGMFFEFDGTTLYTVLRSSTNQVSGTVSVTNGSATVTGSSTAFLTQLQPGQFIVIRGQSYRIVQIASATSLSVSPEYRGTTIANAVVSQTIDIKTPQSQWLDKCDGTGPSGYNLDLTRMQMWYIDYSWYGAGFIRFGVRGTNGLVTYVNQIQNNNRQFEAYMRSGNMAAHYEVSGIPPQTFLTAPLSATGTTLSANILINSLTIPVAETNVFNPSGGVARLGSELIFYTTTSVASGAGNLVGCTRGFSNTVADDQASGTSITPSSMTVNNAAGFPTPAQTPATLTVEVMAAGGNIEYINYTGITASGIIFGLTRAATGGQGTAQSFATGDVRTSVEFVAPASVPSLSHWGSSAIMDGRFDDDKSLIFNYGSTPLTTTTSTTQLTPILAIRVAPAVDNGTTGLLGVKEIINRMQLQLFELGIFATGPLLVNLVLNGTTTGTYSGSFISPVTTGVGAITSSLSQVAVNTTNTVTVVGGESVAAAFTNTNGQTTLDLTQVRDLGNSILGGGTTNTLPTTQAGFYPDGPDILYVCVTPLTASAITVNARLSWKEAQA